MIVSVETFKKWLETLPIGKMNHIGMYYEFLTGKEFHNMQRTARAPAVRWLKEYFYVETCEPFREPFRFDEHIRTWCEEKGYIVNFFSDWRGQGFLFDIREITIAEAREEIK